MDRPRILCTGHDQTVTVVAVSPGGRRLLSGSQDKTARLWDGETGKLLRSSSEPTFWILTLAISPDGQLAVSPRDPSGLRVWEVETGKERCVFTGHKVNVRSVVFSADGRKVFSGGPDGTLFLWEAADGTVVRRFTGQPESVACVALSEDCRWALTGGSAGLLTIWDLAANKGRPLGLHKGSALVAVGFTNDDHVVSADNTRAIRVWETGGRLVKQIDVKCEGPVQRAAVSPSGDRIACACEDGTIRLIDLGTGKETACLRGHVGGVMAVAFSPEGRLIASGGKDRTVRLWDVPR
jgi:tricorn protease-like protein